MSNAATKDSAEDLTTYPNGCKTLIYLKQIELTFPSIKAYSNSKIAQCDILALTLFIK